MSNLPSGYARLRLVRMGGVRAPDGVAAPADAIAEEGQLNLSLRKYFYDKYVYAASGTDTVPAGAQS